MTTVKTKPKKAKNNLAKHVLAAVPKPKCYNCKFAGEQFKIVGKTHLHCHNTEAYPEKDFESGKLSPWDTLMEFWQTCKLHEFRKA